MKWLVPVVVTLLVGLQAAQAEIFIQNDQQYVGNDGTLHVVGEVYNDSTVPIGQILVSASVYSGQQLAGVYDSPALLNNLMPGMSAPFDIVVPSAGADEISSYDLSLEYRPGAHKRQAIGVISSELSDDALGGVVISGIITNDGESTANAVTVVATLYDAHGNVAAASREQMADYIRSSDESRFVVRLIPGESAISGYGLAAESEEYAAIPEFPFGTGAMLALSVFGYILVGRYWGRVITAASAKALPATILTADVCSTRRA